MTMTRKLLSRLRRPQTTVRWRLTLVYGVLFLGCGAALLAITYALVANATTDHPLLSTFLGHEFGPVPPEVKAASRFIRSQQQIADLHQLEIESGIALAIMSMASMLLGWVVAGRVLRPAAHDHHHHPRDLVENSLNRRLAIAGPRDELMELAETIDGLLERLEAAFEAQRRFVANASHELRTPLAMMRTTLDVAVAKPGGVPLQTRALDADLRLDLDHADRLLDGFLVLGARAASRAGRPAPRCARAGDRRRAGVAGWRDCGIPDRGTHGAHPGLRPWERDPAGADGWKRDRERCEERHSDQPGKSQQRPHYIPPLSPAMARFISKTIPL